MTIGTDVLDVEMTGSMILSDQAAIVTATATGIGISSMMMDSSITDVTAAEAAVNARQLAVVAEETAVSKMNLG